MVQGRLVQELKLELEVERHRVEMQAAEAAQRLRLSKEAAQAARADAARLKQEQHEDARMMEVGLPSPFVPISQIDRKPHIF